MHPLQPFLSTAESIAKLLHPYAEVAVHDLSTETLAYIYNNFSDRKIGEDSLLDEIEFNAHTNVIGPYEKLNWDGKRLQSISSILRNVEGKAIGLLCINLDISMLHHSYEILGRFIHRETLIPQPSEFFKDDYQDKINQFIYTHLQQRNQTVDSLSRQDKRDIVLLLKQQGGFQGKHVAEHVGKILRLSRSTVYNILKDTR